jgi:hypothetical protein
MRQLNLAAPSLFILAVLAGCASTAFNERQSYADEMIARPDRIVVYDFAATLADVPSESALAGLSVEHPIAQTPEQIETGRTLGVQVARNLVAEIQDMGLPVVQAMGQPVPQAGDFVIRGYFVSIGSGNAGKRVLIGFDSGTADLRSVVEGYLETDQGLYRLEKGLLDPGNGKKQGGLVGLATLAETGNPLDPVGDGASKPKGERKGPPTIGDAAQGTAREIADQLRVKFRAQGWI